MERIKQALDKARAEREQAGTGIERAMGANEAGAEPTS